MALFPEARPRWHVPAGLAAVLAGLLAVAAVHVVGVRADLAADRGVGPQVAVAAVASRVAPPVEFAIPDLGIGGRLVGLRKDRGGALQVPEDPNRAGWYSQGAAPGDDGPAVIAGHVDSYRGPGIFAGLASLQPGQLVHIRRSDGTVVDFAVQEVASYPKSEFPTERVYGSDGTPSLRLVTCGGEFDRGAGSYLDNVVVYAAVVPD